MAEIELSVSQAITRLKNRVTSILFIFKSYSWKFHLEIFSFLFAFSIFLCCRFSLKVHASGSQARQETAKRAMNGTYSQTGDAATPPVVCNAKKMQCQQQKKQWQRRRQEKSVKIMQFMRYTWQEEQRFLAGTRTQGLTKVHRQREREREGGSNTLGASCFACCVAVPSPSLSLFLSLCCCPPHFWQHKFANHVHDLLRCNAALLLLLSCVLPLSLSLSLFVCSQSDSSSCSSCCCVCCKHCTQNWLNCCCCCCC